ncbi:hypothetical protein MNBD_ALPHA11-2417 [hydrothermal vent metagenome]|uniref:Uncharacterized protein n=1 Tax=hydrothermal vent metagenome TaxID=652676 RepID=A0A3B0TPG9_9ZZZZ
MIFTAIRPINIFSQMHLPDAVLIVFVLSRSRSKKPVSIFLGTL